MKPAKIKKPIPFAFVLDALTQAQPTTRPMFGCLAVYVDGKIMCVLREKSGRDPDNGVWIATTLEHHAALKKDFPSMRSIRLFESEKPTGWQNLPSSAKDFEESALRLCDLILKRDPRVGKIPSSAKKKTKK